MTLEQSAHDERSKQIINRLNRLLADSKRKNEDLHDLQHQNSELQARLDILERISNVEVTPPDWLSTVPRSKSKHYGIPTLFISDCHFDEVVRSSEVEGANEFNRKIAIKRLQTVVDGTITVLRRYFSGLSYEGFELMLGGDLLSGNIHEELEQTNEDTVIASVVFWIDHLVAAVERLADEFGKIHVDCVVGNHGRNTRKPRAKLRVKDNFDWMLYKMLATAMRNDKRLSFNIPESADATVRIYDTNYRLTHGDQFRGGSGISGMMAPLLLGSHRKATRQMTLRKTYDWLCMGHWHEYWMGKGIIVNGSLKGYDEYAYVSNFPMQRPIQAMWVTTPENGATFPAAIYADEYQR